MHNSEHDVDLKSFRDMLRGWVAREVVPHYKSWDEAGIVPREIYRKAGEQGLLCLSIPEAYGGLGLDFRYSAVLIEELARVGASGLAFYLHSDIVAPYIAHYGSEAQKLHVLPKMASGEWIGAIAMTEPGAGSDLQSLRTHAAREADTWKLSGQKTFISNGILADVVVVVANTEPAPPAAGTRSSRQSLFLVEAGTAGFERGRKLKKIGLHAQDTAELYFQDCRIPAANLLGEEGQAFKYLMRELGRERLCIAVWCVARAQGVLEETVRYVRERRAFGKSLADLQNTRFKLAELDTEISLGETYVDRCIREFVRGDDVTIPASKAKYWTSEMLSRVADECLQLHGGYGYMDEYPVSAAFTDARIQRIFGGATEIMKEIIARSLLNPRP